MRLFTKRRCACLAMSAMFGACALFSVVGPAHSADEGDVRKGHEFAKSICARCHAIEAGQKLSPVKAATPFEVFVNTPGVNRLALLVFLHTPHPTIPNLIVAGEDADDVIAYMLSLKKAD
jgi:mono/diheme cytochrome c family protein